jgi:hypothetical protein
MTVISSFSGDSGGDRHKPLARTLLLLLGMGLAACTGSPATLAMQPDFDVATPAGTASVSIRQAPLGMPDRQFARLVETGMEQTAPGSVIPGPVNPPFPAHRIVWHVTLAPTRGMSRIVVNVFDRSVPYAYEQDVIDNDAPEPILTSTIRSLSRRLLADIAARPRAEHAYQSGRV